MEAPEERPQEGQGGYPEEQPAGVDDAPREGKPRRDGGDAGDGDPASANEDEGTATGNPHAAGG